MTDRILDVVGIGNAIVDIISQTDDTVIAALGLNKGAMTLIDAARADHLYSQMGPAIEASGGSAGNTIAGVASLGGRGAFIGKVSNDQFGGVFRHDIRAAGVVFETSPAVNGAPTARSLIFVTPDAQRTMNTYLGACQELTPADIDPHLIQRAKVTYLEGYLWDPPLAKEAFLKAARIAHDAGQEVALSLSDSFCVQRYLREFQDLVMNHVDILFANIGEICSLWEVETFEEALAATRRRCEIAALTRSAHGSVIVAGDELHVVPAAPVERVVDTTGAGDLYAAGFLYGLTAGKGLYESGRIGSLAAAEVISHVGPRPQTSLAELLLEQLP
jgi:sugar/nucleoside kinase (ribokinase family)